jgi:hypothetical protein
MIIATWFLAILFCACVAQDFSEKSIFSGIVGKNAFIVFCKYMLCTYLQKIIGTCERRRREKS